MELIERASYIKGLMDGMKLDEEKNEVKILRAMSELICDTTKEIEALSRENDELFEIVDGLDETVNVLLEESMPDDAPVEAECPKCNSVFIIEDHMIESGNIICPSCGHSLEIDIDEQECDCCKHDCRDNKQ